MLTAMQNLSRQSTVEEWSGTARLMYPHLASTREIPWLILGCRQVVVCGYGSMRGECMLDSLLVRRLWTQAKLRPLFLTYTLVHQPMLMCLYEVVSQGDRSQLRAARKLQVRGDAQSGEMPKSDKRRARYTGICTIRANVFTDYCPIFLKSY